MPTHLHFEKCFKGYNEMGGTNPLKDKYKSPIKSLIFNMIEYKKVIGNLYDQKLIK